MEHSELFFWRGRDVSPLNFLTWRFDLSQLLMQMPGQMAAPQMIAQYINHSKQIQYIQHFK